MRIGIVGTGSMGHTHAEAWAHTPATVTGIVSRTAANAHQLAERTGFSEIDAAIIKRMLPKLFENDASSARPDGTMQVMKVIWWQHNIKSGQYSSAKVHDSLRKLLQTDGTFDAGALKGSLSGLEPEVIAGF